MLSSHNVAEPLAFVPLQLIIGNFVKPKVNQRRRWKRFRYPVEAAVVRAVAWVVPHLSHRTVRRVAYVAGWVGYYMLGKQRRIALANLDSAYGNTKSQAEKARIARVSFQNFAATMLGHFWALRLDADTLPQIADIDPANLEFFRQIHARGKGIILITLHHGNWELLGLATGWYGVKMTVVSRTMRNSALETVFRRLRAHSGHQIISSHRALITLFRTVKQGGTVALLIDQQVPTTLGGIWVDFFGLPSLSTSAVAHLALRSEAAIVGCVAHPLPNGRYRIVYGPEIPTERTGNEEADVRAITQRCMSFCEQVVREQPEYWLWSYKRWKHSPTMDLTGYPFYTCPPYPKGTGSGSSTDGIPSSSASAQDG